MNLKIKHIPKKSPLHDDIKPPSTRYTPFVPARTGVLSADEGSIVGLNTNEQEE